jgi:hypothetical protein
VQTPVLLIGMEEINSVSGISLSPNPVSKNSVLHLSFSQNSSSNYGISIFDSRGKKVIEKKVSTNSVAEISTEGLSPGVYMINALNTQGKIFRAKFIVAD